MRRIIEIRTYQLKSGTANEFHALMRTQSLPLLRASGMDVVAARACLHDSDSYVLIRAYSDLSERAQRQDLFYASAAWLQGPRTALLASIESYSTVVLAVTESTIDGLRHPLDTQ